MAKRRRCFDLHRSDPDVADFFASKRRMTPMKRTIKAIILAILIAAASLLLFSCLSLPTDPADNATPDAGEEPTSGTIASATSTPLPTATASPKATVATAAPTPTVRPATDAPATINVTPDPTDEPEPTSGGISESETIANYAIYRAAIDKNNSLDDIEQIQKLKSEVTLTYTGGVVITENTTTVSEQYKGRHGADPISHVNHVSTVISGAEKETSEIDMYVGHDNLFIKNETMTEHIVVSKSDPQAQSIMALMTEDQLISYIFPEESFSTASVQERNDGSKLLDITFTNKFMRQYNEDMFAQMEETYKGLGATTFSSIVDSMTARYTISPEGYIVHLELSASYMIMFTLNGVSVMGTGNITSTGKVTDPSMPVNIEFPDGTVN